MGSRSRRPHPPLPVMEAMGRGQDGDHHMLLIAIRGLTAITFSLLTGFRASSWTAVPHQALLPTPVFWRTKRIGIISGR